MNEQFLITGLLVVLIIFMFLSLILYILLRQAIQRNANLNIKYMNTLTTIKAQNNFINNCLREKQNAQSELDIVKRKLKRNKK